MHRKASRRKFRLIAVMTPGPHNADPGAHLTSPGSKGFPPPLLPHTARDVNLDIEEIHLGRECCDYKRDHIFARLILGERCDNFDETKVRAYEVGGEIFISLGEKC